ncbi:Gag-Pol polyprotein [Plecturocebus cupreus]
MNTQKGKQKTVMRVRKTQNQKGSCSALNNQDVNLTGLAGAECYEDGDRLGSISLGLREPMVRIQVGGQETDFIIDTGAEHSRVTQSVGPLTKSYTTIIGATGYVIGEWEVQHEFLYLPNCPISLLGTDLLQKLWAQISVRLERNATLDFTKPMAMV